MPRTRDDGRVGPREGALVLLLLAAAVGLRLVAIDQPFVDHWSWRQSLLAMVARNLYTDGFDLFHPHIDVAGSAPGYVGMEFPLVPFLAALLYVPFGVHEWVARLVPVAFFAASVPFLHALVRKAYGARSAAFALLIYALAPLSLFSSRSFMSDMPTLALSVAAVHLYVRWLEQPGGARFVLAALATALAILVKLPSILIGIPFLYLAWQRFGARLALRADLWLFGAMCLAPAALWYSHGYLVSIREFPFELWGFQRTKLVAPGRFLEALGTTLLSGLTPFVCVALALGFPRPARGELRWMFHVWLAAVVAFWIPAGEGFAMHAWYGLPMVPAAAALGGSGLDLALRWLGARTSSSVIRVGVAGSVLLAFAWNSYGAVRPRYEPWARAYRHAGLELARRSPADALVAFAGVGDPTGIYYSSRRGCSFYAPVRERDAVRELRGLRQEGVRYLAITQQAFWWLESFALLREHLEAEHRRLVQTDEYLIYQLAGPSGEFVEPPRRRPPPDWLPVDREGPRCGCTAFGYECFPVPTRAALD